MQGRAVVCENCGTSLPSGKLAYCSDICKQRAKSKRKYHRMRERDPNKLRERSRRNYERKHVPVFEREFVAWDGEGYDGKLVLLANSTGATCWNENGISTRQAFDFLLSGPDNVANVWFGFGWDVNMMLGDLPFGYMNHSIKELSDNGYTVWNGRSISYWPRKNFGVRELFGPKRSFWSADTFGFFQTSFIRALEAWNIPVPAFVYEGKEGRGAFENWNREQLTKYNAEECKLLVQLMNALREACRDAGWKVNDWNGAGALAAHWLRREGVKRYLVNPTGRVQEAATRAYFGGRTEAACWGNLSRVYHYDINSAYPAAMRECIDLRKMSWRRTDRMSDQPFSLLRIQWESPWNERVWGPFPWRGSDGRIIFPPKGEGWYYGVEVHAAMRRLGSKLKVKVVAAYEPWGEPFYPMREPIEESFAHRRKLKEDGRAAHVPIKLALNSLYGKLAQRQARSDKGPPYYNLLWAGYITAATRAKISDAIAAAGEQVACVMTDGVWSLVPLDLPQSSKLGEWSFESEDEGLSLIGAGVYVVHHKDGTETLYSRGFDKFLEIPIPDIIRAWERGEEASITQTIPRFIGMKLALISPDKFRKHWRTFTTVEKMIGHPAITNSKRFGNPVHKRALPEDEPHWLLSWEVPERGPRLSRPYKPVTDANITDNDWREERAADEIQE